MTHEYAQDFFFFQENLDESLDGLRRQRGRRNTTILVLDCGSGMIGNGLMKSRVN